MGEGPQSVFPSTRGVLARTMSPKRLLPLVVILILLGVLAVLFKRSPAPPPLAQEVGLERLVPQTLHTDSITGFDLYRGAQPQEVVRLRQRDGAWVVTSRFDTPGNSTKIQQFLTQLSTLQGELRSDSMALLGDFQLTDEQALHLKVYSDTPDKPALYLLAGKGSGGNGFVRRAGEGRVYYVNVHVQSLAGLTSGTTEQALSAKPWIDLRLQNVPKEQVAAVELRSPTRALRFTTQPAAPTGGTDAAQTPAAPPAPVWTLVAPELAYSVKSDAVEGLVTTLRALQGDDVVDPAQTEEYGLNAPPYRAILTVHPSDQEARQTAVLIGNEVPEKSGSRYARLGDVGPVYIVPQWVMQRLFPTLGTLLDLRLLQVPQEEVIRLTLHANGESWSLERQAPAAATPGGTPAPTATWQFVSLPDVPVDETAVTSLLDATAQLSADDLPASPPAQTGLEQPPWQVFLTRRDGRTERLVVGQAVGQDSSGYYASRGDTGEVFIVSGTIQKTLTDAVTKLKPSPAAAAKVPARP
jgi:hypothetical protein